MILFEAVPDTKIREYSRLFTGSNNDSGYENIYLSYTSNVKEIIFNPGEAVQFNYPNSATSIPLSATTLISDGAMPGNIPVNSDRIFKKQAGYSRYTGWQTSDPNQTGTWACAWLSGSPDSTPVWADRYYNPGFISLQQAISAEPSYIRHTPVVYDIPSTLLLESGGLYTYQHFGDDDNTRVVNNYNTNLQLYLSAWGAPEKVNDKKLNTINFENTFPYKVTYFPLSAEEQMTVSAWIKSANWYNTRGNQIFGNYFRGGMGLTFESGYNNPIMAIFEEKNGHILIANKEAKFLADRSLAPDTNTAEPMFIAVDRDSYIWVIDNQNGRKKYLSKIDSNGEITQQVTFSANALIMDLKLDGFGNPFVFVNENNTSIVYQFENNDLTIPPVKHIRPWRHNKVVLVKTSLTGQDCDIVTKKCFSEYSLRLDRLNGDLITDLSNTVWQARIVAPGIWEIIKFRIANDGGPQFVQDHRILQYHSMKVDPYNNIWILHGTNEYVKIDARTCEIIARGTIGYNDITSLDKGTREICFAKEYIKNEYMDVAWIFDGLSKKIYKTDLNGNIIKIINLSNKLDFTRYNNNILGDEIKLRVRGDFLGTDWAIKYVYQPKTSAKLGYTIRIKTPINELVDLRLDYDLAKLVDDEWYMFSMVFNSGTGTLAIYKNSVLEKSILTYFNQYGDEISLRGCKLYNAFNNSFIFGGNAGRFSNLYEEIQISSFEFNGSIAEPRIYNKALNQNDLWHLVLQSFSAKPLIWNALFGEQVLVEEIERFFKHKLPGSKSKFYNLNLKNLNISDSNLRQSIEQIIRKVVKNVAPAHTELHQIKWQ